jgi:hypothetical protein
MYCLFKINIGNTLKDSEVCGNSIDPTAVASRVPTMALRGAGFVQSLKTK